MGVPVENNCAAEKLKLAISDTFIDEYGELCRLLIKLDARRLKCNIALVRALQRKQNSSIAKKTSQ